MHETIHDVYDLQKGLMQTSFDLDQHIIDAILEERHDRLRSCVRAGGGHFEHML